ncbi:MAG TPA: DUF3857 domain-containing protein [Saprospiraceae bacterium]|nr:DUF3857 domain-containing protein [Saprospiraceae bacterium]
MNTKKIYLLALVLLQCLCLTAQDIKKISWGKIPQEDLSMTVYPLDSAAEAVVLDEVGEMYFYLVNGVRYSYTTHKRIKILKEGGIERGNILINYYHEGGAENIKGLKAQVIAPDGSITKVKDENIFNEKLSESRSQKKVVCPNVQIGSIIELSYKIESDRWTVPRDWYFQSDIPVRHSQMEFIPVEDVTYIKQTKGFAPITEKNGFFIATNLPALKEEPYISTIDDYLAKVSFQLHGYKNSNGVYKPYLANWKAISEVLNESFSFGHRVYNDGQISDTWNLIKNDLDLTGDSLALASAIYTKVTKQVKWDEKYRLFADRKGDEVYKSQTGTSAEINALIINLMRKANLDAHPVVTNPRSFGRFNATYPLVDNLGHVLGSVVIGGKRILFDGTNQYRPFGIVDEEDLTTDALLINKKEAKIIPVEVQNESESHSIELALNAEGQITGTISSKYRFLSIEDEAEAKENKSFETRWKSRLEKLSDNITISDYEASFGEGDFKSKFKFIAAAEFDQTEDLLYVPTGIYSQFLTNPFKLVDRKFPIDFGHQISETVVTSFDVPEDYVVEALPANLNLSTTNKEVTYNMACSNLNKKVQIVRRTNILSPYILPTEYGAVRGIFDKIEVKNNDIIVLKKKAE